MSPKPDLPDDLARLGLYLEVATSATVARRQRRQAALNFVGAVVLAVPFALAAAADDLSQSDTFLPHRPATISLAVQPPTNGFMVRHIPDEPLPPPSKERCLDAHDCRAPIAPSLQPAPAGKH